MVGPAFLKDNCIVDDPVKCKIVNPKRLVRLGYLGDSGYKMAKSGASFYFTKNLFLTLLKCKLVEADNEQTVG